MTTSMRFTFAHFSSLDTLKFMLLMVNGDTSAYSPADVVPAGAIPSVTSPVHPRL